MCKLEAVRRSFLRDIEAILSRAERSVEHSVKMQLMAKAFETEKDKNIRDKDSAKVKAVEERKRSIEQSKLSHNIKKALKFSVEKSQQSAKNDNAQQRSSDVDLCSKPVKRAFDATDTAYKSLRLSMRTLAGMCAQIRTYYNKISDPDKNHSPEQKSSNVSTER
jgi:hypothetical protein